MAVNWIAHGSLLAILWAAAARAESPTTASRQTRLCDGEFVSTSALTDYRFDGLSESNRGPTWQVTAYCYRNNGLYVGTMFTGVDFEDKPRTRFEADWYIGRQVRWRGAKLTFNLLYASFPDKRAPGPSYDLVEPQITVATTVRKLRLEVTAGWEADVSGRGRAWRFRSGAEYPLAPWFSLSGHFGQFVGAAGVDHDHRFFDVGATANWRRFSLDVRYGGTDLPMAECFYTRWCQPGASATVSWRVLP